MQAAKGHAKGSRKIERRKAEATFGRAVWEIKGARSPVEK